AATITHALARFFTIRERSRRRRTPAPPGKSLAHIEHVGTRPKSHTLTYICALRVISCFGSVTHHTRFYAQIGSLAHVDFRGGRVVIRSGVSGNDERPGNGSVRSRNCRRHSQSNSTKYESGHRGDHESGWLLHTAVFTAKQL